MRDAHWQPAGDEALHLIDVIVRQRRARQAQSPAPPTGPRAVLSRRGAEIWHLPSRRRIVPIAAGAGTPLPSRGCLRLVAPLRPAVAPAPVLVFDRRARERGAAGTDRGARQSEELP